MEFFKEIDGIPSFSYDGNLVYYVMVRSFGGTTLMSDTITVSSVKRQDNTLLNLYVNDKRKTGKRIDNNRPLKEEAVKFINAIAYDMQWEKLYEC